jgi:hypothetical protein
MAPGLQKRAAEAHMIAIILGTAATVLLILTGGKRPVPQPVRTRRR